MTEALRLLAERVEKASGPNFQLEQEIGAAVFLRQAELYPPYTASLDAAMLLVPEGFDWLVRNDVDEKFAHVTRNFHSIIEISGGETRSMSTGDSFPSYAATPALALCAASLRARASQEQRNEP